MNYLHVFILQISMILITFLSIVCETQYRAIPTSISSKTSSSQTVAITPTPSIGKLQVSQTTAIPIKTVTTPSISSLLPKHISNTLEQLMQVNKSCRLPCWWGMMPGISKWSNSKSLFNDFSGFIQDTNSRKTVNHAIGGEKLYDDVSSMSLYITEEEDIIKYISLYVDNRTNSLEFSKLWTAYSPEKIVEMYGKPSRIWLQSGNWEGESGPPKILRYTLWLFYDVDGFLIQYDGFVKNESIFLFCPVFKKGGNLNSGFAIHLKSPTNHYLLENIAAPDIGYAEGLTSITDVTKLSIDEFVQRLSKKNIAEVCVKVPRSFWP